MGACVHSTPVRDATDDDDVEHHYKKYVQAVSVLKQRTKKKLDPILDNKSLSRDEVNQLSAIVRRRPFSSGMLGPDPESLVFYRTMLEQIFAEENLEREKDTSCGNKPDTVDETNTTADFDEESHAVGLDGEYRDENDNRLDRRKQSCSGNSNRESAALGVSLGPSSPRVCSVGCITWTFKPESLQRWVYHLDLQARESAALGVSLGPSSLLSSKLKATVVLVVGSINWK